MTWQSNAAALTPEGEPGRPVPSADRANSRELRLDERAAILNQEVCFYAGRGYRVVDETETTAHLVRPRGFSCFAAFLGLLLFGVGLVCYIAYVRLMPFEAIYLEVDPYGVVRTEWPRHGQHHVVPAGVTRQ